VRPPSLSYSDKSCSWSQLDPATCSSRSDCLIPRFCDGSGRTWLNDILGALPMPESGTEEPRDLLCKAVERLRPVTCQSKMAVHPLTQLHRGHIGNYGNLSKAELAGMMAIEADPTCLQWLKGRGYLDGFGEV